MKLDKKGFTLVELLAVIVVLGIIAALAFTGYLGLFKGSKEDMVEVKKQNIELAAESWGQKNLNSLGTNCSKYYGLESLKGFEPQFCLVKTVTDLVDSGFLATEEHSEKTGFLTVTNDVTKNSMMCDEVLIYRKNNRVYATIYNLKSNNSNAPCER